MRRLALLLLLSLGCDSNSSNNNSCGKEVCCETTVNTGVACGTVRQICGVDPIGNCVCGEDFKWSCFGTQDLAIDFPDLRREVD